MSLISISIKRSASRRSSLDEISPTAMPVSSSSFPSVPSSGDTGPSISSPPTKRQRTGSTSNDSVETRSVLRATHERASVCSNSNPSNISDTASTTSGSDDEWSYEESCKYFAAHDIESSSADENQVRITSESRVDLISTIESLSSLPDMSNLSLDAEPLEDSQCISDVAPTLSVGRSLPLLEMPSIVWSNTRFAEFESREFTNTVAIRVQRVPLNIVDPGERWYPVQRSNFLGVEELILTLPTSTMNMIKTNKELKLVPKVWLSNSQLHAGVQFLTEALLSVPEDQARKKHVTRWGDMKPSALVLGAEGLEREVMALVVSFLASVDDDDTTQINTEMEKKKDLRDVWKGLLKPEDLPQLEKIAKHWRQASLLS